MTNIIIKKDISNFSKKQKNTLLKKNIYKNITEEKIINRDFTFQDLEDMNYSELKSICKKLGIDFSKLNANKYINRYKEKYNMIYRILQK